jgi:hypothetical protein
VPLSLPPLVGGVELLDGGFVVAVLEVADLDFVDAFQAQRRQGEHLADGGARLRGPLRDGVRDHADVMRPLVTERACLLVTEVGQCSTGWPCVQPPFDVGV